MLRKFSFEVKDWGILNLCVVFEYEDGKWSEEMEPIRSNPELKFLSNLITKVDRFDYEDALRGHCWPLIKSLGPSPKACFLKIPEEHQSCLNQKGCAAYTSKCYAQKDPPICYVPNIDLNAGESTAVLRMFQELRLGYYIILVEASDEF